MVQMQHAADHALTVICMAEEKVENTHNFLLYFLDDGITIQSGISLFPTLLISVATCQCSSRMHKGNHEHCRQQTCSPHFEASWLHHPPTASGILSVLVYELTHALLRRTDRCRHDPEELDKIEYRTVGYCPNQ